MHPPPGFLFFSVSLHHSTTPMGAVVSVHKNKLPSGLALPVRRILTSLETKTPEEQEIVPAKKTEHDVRRIEKCLRSCWLFQDVQTGVLSSIVETIGRKSFQKSETIVEQGSRGSLFYLIEEGTVDVIIDGSKKKELTTGAYFGEVALLYEAPRSATVKVSSTTCTLWILDKHSFRLRLRKEGEDSRRNQISILLKIPFFSRFSRDAAACQFFSRLSDSLEERKYKDGEIVVERGEEGYEFFIVKEGSCEVKDAQESENDGMRKLIPPGGFFGEQV